MKWRPPFVLFLVIGGAKWIGLDEEWLKALIICIGMYFFIEIACTAPAFLSNQRSSRKLASDLRKRARDEQKREEARRRELERQRRIYLPPSQSTLPVIETPEQKLERLLERIENSNATPEKKESLKSKARNDYEAEIDSQYSW